MMKKTLFILILCFIHSMGWETLTAQVSPEIRKILNRASAAMEAKDVDGAIEEFKKIIDLDASNAYAFQKLGELNESSGKYKEAIDSYNKYLQLAPNASDVSDIETRRDKLEYKQEKAEKNNAAMAALKSSWKTQQFQAETGKFYFVFDIDEFDGTYRVTLSHLSAFYDPLFVRKTAIAKKEGNTLRFSFSTDQNFNPEQDKAQSLNNLAGTSNIVTQVGGMTGIDMSSLTDLGSAFNLAGTALSMIKADPAYNQSTTYSFNIKIFAPDSLSGYCNFISSKKVSGEAETILQDKLIKVKFVRGAGGGSYTGSGKETLNLPNGDIYEGDFSNGAYNGQGKLISKNGNIYTGGFANSKRDGKGLYRWKNGDEYSGSWAMGIRNGDGIFRFTNGDTYACGFINGKLKTTGKYTSQKGDIFEDLDALVVDKKVDDKPLYDSIRMNMARVLVVAAIEYNTIELKSKAREALSKANIYALPDTEIKNTIERMLSESK